MKRSVFFVLSFISLMFISCFGEYNDSELRMELQSSETLISDLVTKLAAIRTAQEALPTIEEIEKAKKEAIENVEKDADEKVAAALKAAITADAEEVSKVNLKLNSLETELKQITSQNITDIDVLKEKVKNFDAKFALLEGSLQTLQGLVADNEKQLKQVNAAIESIEGKITLLEEKVVQALKQIANNLSAIEAQKIALESYRTSTTVDLNLLEQKLKENYSQFQIFKLKMEELLSDVTKQDLDRFKAFLNQWETVKKAIDKSIEDLGIHLTNYVTKMVTNLSIRSILEEKWFHEVVINDTPFGPSQEIELPQKGTLNGFFSYRILFRSNPSNVDWKNLNLRAENTIGEELPVFKFGIPVPNSIKFVSSKKVKQSGLWSVRVLADWSEIEGENVQGVDIHDYFINKYLKNDLGYYTHFALVASEKIASQDNQVRKVYSDYKIQFVPIDPVDAKDISITNSGAVLKIYKGTVPSYGEYINPEMSSSAQKWEISHVWKKYLIIKNGATPDQVDNVYKVVDGNDEIRIASKDELLKNKVVTFTMFYLNYDGSRSYVDFNVFFVS